MQQIQHMSFCIKILTRKIAKLLGKNPCVKCNTFSSRNDSFIFLAKGGAQKRKYWLIAFLDRVL